MRADERALGGVHRVDARGLPAARWQWLGLLLAPAAFFGHLQLAYAMVPWACAHHGELWIHVVGAASVLVALLGTLIAWRVWRAAGGEEPGEGAGPWPRTRFMGATGLGTSAVLALVLLAQWIVAFFISPCQ